MIKERDISIDVLRGIGIVFVLVAHSLGGLIHNFAYSFHMPLFFIVTGYFFKSKPIISDFKSSFRRLIIPFYFSTLLMLIISILLKSFHFASVKTPISIFEMMIYGNGSSVNYEKLWGNFEACGSIWFFCALFCAKIVYNVINNVVSLKYIGFLSFCIGMISYILGQKIQLPFSFIQGMTALPFLWIGDHFRKNGLPTINMILILSIIGWLLSVYYYPMDIAKTKFLWGYIPNVLFASAGTYVFYLISKKITEKFKYFTSILAFLGRYSIILLTFPVVETYVIPMKELLLMVLSEHLLSVLPILMIIWKCIWCAFALYISLKFDFLRKLFKI